MTTKPRFRIVANRPVAVRVESPELAKARERFSMATGEKSRKFPHESGSNWFAQPERVLTRWMQKADFLNVKRQEAA